MFKNIHPSWMGFFKNEIKEQYFQELVNNVKNAYLNNECYPSVKDIFRLFKIVNFDDIKVVILGQDPYHQPGQANGLAFAVNSSIKLPPSLKNIYQELLNDLQINNFNNGDLSQWAMQGVFLLNTILTVQRSKPLSHQKFGWEIFTNKVIQYIISNHKNIIFVLWGSKAQSKIDMIDENRHFIIKSVHPSPLSAYQGFFNGRYFSNINKYLVEHNQTEIDWEIK